MKKEIYDKRQGRENKGGRYPIEDRELVRTQKITIKVSPLERKRLSERADEAQLSVSAFMRKAALQARIYPRYTEEERKWMRDSSNWLNNLNQALRYFHSYGADTGMINLLQSRLLEFLKRLEK